ncbi:hypothetical protein LTR65_008354 [Meristemomyces frigidus]
MRLSAMVSVRNANLAQQPTGARKYEQLEQQFSAYRDVVSLLQNSDEPEAFKVLKGIRSGCDVPTALEAAASSKGSSPSDQLTASPSSEESYIMSPLEDAARARRTSAPVPPPSAKYEHSTSSEGSQRISVQSLLLPADESDPEAEYVEQSLLHSGAPEASRAIRKVMSEPRSIRSMYIQLAQDRHTPQGPHEHLARGVQARDWGVYYFDNKSFVGVLECYFAWAHHAWSLFDAELFWDGLARGGSDLCSKALVHSILAFASKLYTTFFPGPTSSAPQIAMDEAKRLLDFEADNATPANIAACFVMNSPNIIEL